MKSIFLLLIHLYRKAVKPYYSKNCIFSESCSYYVEREINEHGFRGGIKAFWERYHSCRPGYHFQFDDSGEEWELIAVDGKQYKKHLIASSIKTEALLMQGIVNKTNN